MFIWGARTLRLHSIHYTIAQAVLRQSSGMLECSDRSRAGPIEVRFVNAELAVTIVIGDDVLVGMSALVTRKTPPGGSR